jgi:hypothetical protein
MSAWETKDIVVVASAIMGLVGTIVVQLVQHVFTARRERLKAVENIRRDLYQNVITNLNTAIDPRLWQTSPSVSHFPTWEPSAERVLGRDGD